MCMELGHVTKGSSDAAPYRFMLLFSDYGGQDSCVGSVFDPQRLPALSYSLIHSNESR